MESPPLPPPAKLRRSWRPSELVAKPKATGTDWKTWVGFFTGLLSIAITSALFYRSVFYQHYAVSVFTNQDHYTLSAKAGSEQLSYSVAAFLVNSGTANVTISNIELWTRFLPAQVNTGEQCEKATPKMWGELRPTKFEPFTVKAGETTAINLQFEGSPQLIRAAVRNDGQYSYGAFCAELRLTHITDETKVQHVPVSSSDYGISPNYGPASYTGGNFFGGNPYMLIDKRRWLLPF